MVETLMCPEKAISYQAKPQARNGGMGLSDGMQPGFVTVTVDGSTLHIEGLVRIMGLSESPKGRI
jgi:hypothetical protein